MHPEYGVEKQLRKIFSIFLYLVFILMSNFANAAYTFTSTGSASGAPGCTGNASGVYTCTSGFNNSGHPVTVNNSSGPVTINITGAMSVYENISISNANNAVTFNISSTLDVGNYTIGSSLANTATNVNIVVGGNTTIASSTIRATIRASGAGTISVGNASVYGSLITSSGSIYAYGYISGSLVSTTGAITKDGGSLGEAIITTTGAISLLNQTTVKHITCDCSLAVGYGVTITGNIQVASLNEDTWGGSQNNYNGSIYTTTGGVKLNFSSDVVGSITSATTVNLSNQNTVNSCVKSGSTSAGAINLAWGVNANSVCCGSSCSNSCVTNNSSFSMPATCTTEHVVISASGSVSYGTYPIMELWVNGTKRGSVSVTSATKDYFFNVVLPTTITSLDVVFTNDAASSDGSDRNLIVNSLTIRGKTFLPTDTGVIIDKGSGASAFDGIDTVVGNTWVVWNAALRFGAISTTATNIAYYAMDEASWNGTANETKDTAGYTGGPFDGQGIGTPKPTSSSVSPARSGSTGTCGYASFSGSASTGSAFTLDGLPVSTNVGAKTSVSFWMYWDGTNNVMPIGWNRYNLYFRYSPIRFGFNHNDDLFGLSSTDTADLANGWHHVVAVFTNGDQGSNKLYIDGVSKPLTQTSSTDPSGAYVQPTMQVSGYQFIQNFRFINGRIDEVKIYNGEMTQAQVTADYNATHVCPSYSVAAANFNCVVTGQDGATGRLYTRLAGISTDSNAQFDVDVVALKSNGSVETSFVEGSSTKNVTLEFVGKYDSTSSKYVTGTMSTTCSVLTPIKTQTITFSASDAGRKNVTGITIPAAYRDLRCRVTDNNQTPSVTACSSDNFAVRPFKLEFSSSNANGDPISGSNTSAINPIKAGTSFNLALRAQNGINQNISGYDGVPTLSSDVNTSRITPHTGGIKGSLSGSFLAADPSTGVASGSFNYSEVGYFILTSNGAIDSDFAAVDRDAGDCISGSPTNGLDTNGKRGCNTRLWSNTPYLGRFIPDHFAITAGSNTEGCNSGDFTYFGQDGLTTAFIIAAQNTSNITTQNYIGSYAKLDLSSWSNFAFSSSTLPSGSTLAASATAPSGSWSSGLASVSAKHKISRPSSATAPTNISIFATPVDSDGVTVSTATAVSSATPFRYGRLWMSNVYGSELLNLTIPIEAQYWDGSTYRRNQLDSCTAIAPANIAMGSYKGNLTACETVISGGGTMAAGKTTMTLSKPGNGNNGSVDLSINLNSTAGSTCTSSTASNATNANLPQFGTNNPAARETFGLFKSPIIYMRESF